MQLFHEEHTIQNNNLIISNPDTIAQCRKVLRLKTGDIIHVQSTKANTTTRHLVRISDISQTLIGEIIETTTKNKWENYTQIFVAMPNKHDKLELIAQKLTELWVDEIVFRPAERSIIKQRNKNKEQRLHLIVKEATEQSRGWFIPQISFREHPEDTIQKDSIVYIFDKKENATTSIESSSKKTGIIGPEGGLTEKDYNRFAKHTQKTYDLGSTILRMETAAIVGWWLLKSNFEHPKNLH